MSDNPDKNQDINELAKENVEEIAEEASDENIVEAINEDEGGNQEEMESDENNEAGNTVIPADVDIVDSAGAETDDPKTDTAEDTDEIIESPVEVLEIPAEIERTQEMIDAQYFTPDDEKKRFAEEAFDWIEIFSSALFMVILLFTFVFRLVTVQGPSMEYTLHGGEGNYPGGLTKDSLIISRLSYKPKPGDIVVIQVPNPNFPTPIIKRVIATEGQTVDFDFENWIVYVDGEPVYEVDGQPAIEPYVNYEEGKFMNSDGISHESLPITVEPGKIFVLGDNRNHSSDSRNASIGQVDIRSVVGRVLVRVFPFDKFGVVKPHEEE